jgi:hypothetical protein
MHEQKKTPTFFRRASTQKSVVKNCSFFANQCRLNCDFLSLCIQSIFNEHKKKTYGLCEKETANNTKHGFITAISPIQSIAVDGVADE